MRALRSEPSRSPNLLLMFITLSYMVPFSYSYTLSGVSPMMTLLLLGVAPSE
jgi:hypothetical protein